MSAHLQSLLLILACEQQPLQLFSHSRSVTKMLLKGTGGDFSCKALLSLTWDLSVSSVYNAQL